MNTVSQSLVLSVRLGKNSIKQHSKLLMCACIFMCVLIASSLNFFSVSVQTSLNNDIAKFLGAPLVVRSAAPVEGLTELIETLEKKPNKGLSDNLPAQQALSMVTTHSITTGAISKDAYQSISFKGVSSGYPLQGQLRITTEQGEQSVAQLDLKQGQALLDSRAMDELQLKLGDSFQVGKAILFVHGVLEFEPDRLSQLQHMLPRVMVSMPSLMKSGVSAAHNKGEFRTLLLGDNNAIAELEKELPAILNNGETILKPNKGQHPFSRISLRAEKMLSVLLVLILIMCGSAASTLASHCTGQYIKVATVLRCMGVNRNSVTLALIMQFSFMAIISSLIACLVAWLIQPLFLAILQPHMQLQASPLNVGVFLQPVLIAITTILAFVAPKLWVLSRFPVNHVLRGITPPNSISLISLLVISALSLIILYFNSDNLNLTAMMVIVVVSLIILSLIFAWTLSKLCSYGHHFFKGPSKVAIRSIGRSPQRHFASLLSISIAMMAILMTATLRGSFIDHLQAQGIEQDGNYIYSSLSSDLKNEFIDTLNGQGGELKNMHPVVKAHLKEINGVAIEHALKSESDTREEARSKVRLSWAINKPNNNKMLVGHWPEPGTNDVSVESEVMSDLGLSLGDTLSFKIGEKTLKSTITSRREFQPADSRVMFWFMFAPDTLAAFEQTMMGGFQLNDQGAEQSLAVIAKQFPSVRIKSLEHQISSIRSIMIALTRLMNTVLLLLMGGALMLILSSSFTNVVNRKSHTVLLRACGLQTKQILSMSMIEQITLSLVACIVGVIGVQLIAGTMFKQLFDLSYQLDWNYAFLLSAFLISSFALLGLLFSFRSTQQSVRLAMQS